MIQPYNYSYSKMQKAQSFVNHVMLDVIFNAKKIPAANFSSALVLPKYKTLIEDVNSDYVLTPLSDAYLICKVLKRNQIKLLKTAVHNNNKIRELCNGDVEPVKYKQIEFINANLAKALKTFCDSLYEHCLDLAPFYRFYEEINLYYKKIVKKSKICKCCGTGPILTQFHSHRGALDHYLPKSVYPFSSLNFKNLIPICEYCNGKYKLAKDTLCKTENKGKKNETNTRVKAFYPYSKSKLDICIFIKFVNLKSLQNIEPENVKIDLKCTNYDEQVETWNRVFGITENYIAECCTDEMRMFYEEQYIADMLFGKTHDQYIKDLKRNKYGDINFLKIPFLEAINK